MSAESKIRELLMQWESLKRHGRQVSVEELCRDCPEFIPALEQNIAALETIDRLLASRQDEPRGTLQPGEESSAVGTASTGDTEDLKAPAPSAGEAGGSSFRFELKPEAEPVPGYRLVSLLGRGGFGEVWKATAPGGFPIAMKFVARLGQREKVETRALNILKSIRHPNLLATFGAWQVGGWLIIAMELGDQTLHDRYQQARAQGLAGVPRDELLEYLHEAAKGIDYLNEPRAGDGGQHAPGAQHRDIKPQNILLVGRGVKVADFGLARLLEHTLTTHTGSLTPGYAAPEFIRGKTSNRSDQYSLAVTYCELRGGRLPFAGSVEQVLLGHLEGSPDLSMLPEEERPAVARALAKDPAERWPSCRAFVEALIGKVRQGPTAVLPGGPVVVTLRHRSRVMSSVILAAAFVLIVTTVARRGGPPAPDVAWKKQQPAIELEPLAAEAAFEGSRKAPRAEESMPTVSPAAVRESTEAQPVEQRQWRLAAGGENVDSELAEREKASTIRAVAAPGGSAPVAPATEASESGAAGVRATAAPPAGGSAAGSAAESGTEVRPEMPLGELLCFRGHSGDVRSVAASPDGRHVLSAGEDRCMRLWEMELGLELHCFTEPTAAVHSVAFSPDGRRAIAGGEDGVVWLWDVATRSKLREMRGHTGDVYCVAFSSDGHRAVSAGRDTTVRLWNVETGDELSQIQVAGESIWSVAFGLDDRQILAASDSRMVRLFDVKSGSEVKRLEGHGDVVWSVGWSGKLGRAISGGGDMQGRRDYSLRLWDTNSGLEVDRLEGHGGAVGSVAFSPDGRRALSGSADMTVRLWDLARRQELHCFRGHTDIVQCVTFSGDGRRAVSAGRDGTVRVWGLPK